MVEYAFIYKMELHVKTRGPGLCRRHSTHIIMQTKIRQLKQFAARSELRIHKKKAQVLRINSRCENIVLIDDQELKEVDKFNYLGANVSKQGGGGENIVNIIRKARESFKKLKYGVQIYTH